MKFEEDPWACPPHSSVSSTQGQLLGTQPVPSSASVVAVVENEDDKGRGTPPCRRKAGPSDRKTPAEWSVGPEGAPVLRELRVQQWGWTDGFSWGRIHVLARTDTGAGLLSSN